MSNLTIAKCKCLLMQATLKQVSRFSFANEIQSAQPFLFLLKPSSNGIWAYVRLLLLIHVVGISLVDSVIVHPQVSPVGKSFSALGASKGPLSHVNVPLVGSQVPAAGESFTTLSTAKRALPCMCASVHSEFRGSEEALFTELTGM